MLVDPDCTLYYHCVSRCVRRAFLCGRDAVTGYNFEHRRVWIESRLKELAEIFAIDLCAYAVMSNHYHIVLHLNEAQRQSWDDDEVIARWRRLYKLPEAFGTAQRDVVSATIARWRERLGSISWFMRCINEPLARIANREDGCKGRFWEGRFRSQALLDEAAVLKCMAYVDLNPVRAGEAASPEASRHTSVQARIKRRDKSLAPMADARVCGFRLPIRRQDYLQLVDHTGRAYRRGKRGKISAALPPIIERLQRTAHREWLVEMSNLTRLYCRAIGSTISLQNYRDYIGQVKLKGLVN